MPHQKVHKNSRQKIVDNYVIIECKVKRQNIMDESKWVKEPDLQCGKKRQAAKYIWIPEREMAGFCLFNHQKSQWIKIS